MMRVAFLNLWTLWLLPIACQCWMSSSSWSSSSSLWTNRHPAVMMAARSLTVPVGRVTGIHQATPNKDITSDNISDSKEYQELLSDNKALRQQVQDLTSQVTDKNARMEDLKAQLQRTNERLEDYRIVFLTTEAELKMEKRQFKKNMSSLRYLLQQMRSVLQTKVTNAYKTITNRRLRRLLKLKKQEDKE